MLHYVANICLNHASVNAADRVFAEQHVEEFKMIIYVVARIDNSKTSGRCTCRQITLSQNSMIQNDFCT